MKNDDKIHKERFFKVLSKAALPLAQSKSGKSKTSGSSSGKRTRQRKPANASD